MTDEFQHRSHEITLDNVPLRIAAISREGHLAPIVLLHASGSPKEDYGDITRPPAFDAPPAMRAFPDVFKPANNVARDCRSHRRTLIEGP